MKKKYKVYLLGGQQDIIETTAEVLKKKYSVNIVGCNHGYFFNKLLSVNNYIDSKNCSGPVPEYNSFSDNDVVNKINNLQPDILFVGLSNEIQEKWIYKNLKKINTKVIIGVGGSFDVISGKLRRAPKIFQVLGLEWYFRLLQEPSRITRIVKLPLAVTVLLIDVIKHLYFKRNTIMARG